MRKAGQLTRARAKRLASLSALGAAALVSGAGEAYAGAPSCNGTPTQGGTIWWSGSLSGNCTAGFGKSTAAGATSRAFAQTVSASGPAGLGPFGLKIQLLPKFRSSVMGSGSTKQGTFLRTVMIKINGKTAAAVHSSQWKGNNTGLIAGTDRGAKWTKIGTATVKNNPGVAFRQSWSSAGAVWTRGGPTSYVGNHGTSHYAEFKFSTVNDKPHWGWVDLDALLSVNSQGNQGNNGPLVTIESFAYNSSTLNPALVAGQTTNVPEPSSLDIELAALGALIAGGSALRRWREGRRAARPA